MSLSVNDVDLIQRALESRLGDVYTALPGRVESYDPVTQCADISPQVKRPLPTSEGDTVYEALPVVTNVPICFPRGGGFTVSWPISVGDTVLLVCTTYAIGLWRASGEVAEAGDIRLHGLGSAVAIPALAPNSGVLPQSQAEDNAFIITGPMVKLGAADASDFASGATQTDQNFSTIQSAITGVTASPQETGLAALQGLLSNAFPSVACTKVKIK